MDTWQAIDRAAPDESRRLRTRACGSSRWVDRMLARLTARLGNRPAQEIVVAAAEQARVTALRLG